ncbi:MAG: glycosyltransferase [Cyanobacteria bacterium]|nr:glycosyltransferase [Cyanobacteria bacterium CG_2015-16_32_12]NCO77160.1 glycosyltransferase [Cyanobacteria bacterium CG_2015-22_32_23]NCQ41611.1 glycosyltransferase [Cyanobacteria bacterium CG_2015-04_32_10]NCS85246.1 glycosyltransferase [Cyanobacteria bacterium CG_2015-02_32_10]
MSNNYIISINKSFPKKRRAIVSICSNNYFPYVRILFNTLQKYHPESELFLCLGDKQDSLFPLDIDNITIIEAEKLNIPHFYDFAFRYDIMEFNTALKPFIMQLLLEEYNFEQVVYLDPDIELFAPLESVFFALDNGSDFVITPHITQPSEEDAYPGDIGVMQSGIYNLGFIAVNNSNQVINFLHWWGRKLRFYCVNEQHNGIFVDQKFVDLLPAFYDNVKILKDTNVNVAYWNLLQRKLEKKDQSWLVDGKPLVFFHFSGIDINNNQRLSKHSNAFNGNLSQDLQELIDDYISKLKYYSFSNNLIPKYIYSNFTNNVFIPTIIRQIYRKLNNIWYENPFISFSGYLNQFNYNFNQNSSDFPLTNLMVFFWKNRLDLQTSFNIFNHNEDRKKYTFWFLETAEENQFQYYFLEPILDNISHKLSHYKSLSFLQNNSNFPINVIGYLKTETGVGQGGRMVIKSLQTANINVQGYHIDNIQSRQNDNQIEDLLVAKINSPIHIYKVNADQLRIVKNLVKNYSNKPDFIINIPGWELSRFPQEWVSNYDDIDEVWAESKFVQIALQSKLSLPIIHMQPAVFLENFKAVNREYFNLPKDRFLFHFNFDFSSFSSRKNPEAVITAYRRAFRHQKSDISTALVIKSRGYDPNNKNYQKLLEIIDGEEDIITINEYLSHSEVMALMNCCDCYVSLHCSEGFGYTLAEAMLLGKPVIATNYSGNCDFINQQTGFPVDYKLVSLKSDEYPFSQGQKWAKPDLDHAAWIMQKMVENSSHTKQIALAGQNKIATDYSPISAGQRYIKRLEKLGLIVNC